MSGKEQGLIIDCSFIMSVLLPDEESERSQEILESGRYTPVAPSLWIIEVSNVLLTAVRKKRISAETRSLLLESIQQIDIRTIDRKPAMEHLVSLASKYDLTAYDAIYLDLALHTGFPVATLDEDLKIAVSKAGLAVV